MAADKRAWLAFASFSARNRSSSACETFTWAKLTSTVDRRALCAKRAHLAQGQAPEIERGLRDFENRFRSERLIVRLLDFDQYLRPGIIDVLILRGVAQFRALLQAGRSSEVGQQLIRDDARRGPVEDARGGDGAGR